MNRDCGITAALKRRQITMFNEARKQGITASVIHYDTGGENGGISLSTLGQWSRGESAMGLEMLIRMIGVIPDGLLSLLLPDGHAICRVPEGIDHDAISAWAETYTAKKLAAHRADSECQERLGPNEKADLDNTVLHLPLKGVVAA